MHAVSDSRKRVLATLCLAQFAAMLIWYNFAAVLPVLRQEWQLSNDQTGTILSAFQLGYVASVLFSGWLTDKVGGRLVFSLCAIETGLASIGFALFASDYSSALYWRILAGIGQGGLYVPGIQILSRWYPAEERGMAIGVYTCSLMASYAGAYFAAAPLAAAFSWQTALLCTSVWALPAAALVFWAVPDHKEWLHRVKSPQERHSVAPVWKMRAVWLIIFGYAGHMWEMYAFNGWIGVYATQVFSGNGYVGEASMAYGGIVAAACMLMGAVSPFLGGWYSDARGRCFSATLILVFGGFGSLAFGWLSEGSLWIFIPSGLFYSFLLFADSAIYKAGLTELVPPEQLGNALSLQSVVGFGVTALSPKLFGMILDSSGWGWAFCLLAFGPLAGVFAMQSLRRMPESICMAGGRR